MKTVSSRSKESYSDSTSILSPEQMRTLSISQRRIFKASAAVLTTPSGSSRPAKKAAKPTASTSAAPSKSLGQRSGGRSLKKSKHAVKLRTLQEIRSSKKPTSKRQKRIRRVSVKKAWDLKQYANIRAIYLANCDTCDVCHSERPTEIHHKRGRLGDLLTDRRHWMAVGQNCHRWIHENPNEARTLGYICEKGLWNTPDRS